MLLNLLFLIFLPLGGKSKASRDSVGRSCVIFWMADSFLPNVIDYVSFDVSNAMWVTQWVTLRDILLRESSGFWMIGLKSTLSEVSTSKIWYFVLKKLLAYFLNLENDEPRHVFNQINISKVSFKSVHPLSGWETFSKTNIIQRNSPRSDNAVPFPLPMTSISLTALLSHGVL